MNRIDFTNLGGFPFSATRADFMQQSYLNALSAIASFIGNKVIITGVVVAGGNVSDGWIVYNGELIKFIGGPVGAGVVVQEVPTAFNFQDGSIHNIQFVKTATCGAPQTFAFSDLVSLNTIQQMWLSGDVKLVQQTMAYIIANFDNTGLGQNERIGWKVCNGQNGTVNMGDRLPLGYNWANIAGIIDQVGNEKGSNTIDMTKLPAAMNFTLPGKLIKKRGG